MASGEADASFEVLEREVPQLDGALAGQPPLLRRVYAARGVAQDSELNLATKALLQPSTLSNVERAAERIVAAIEADEVIVIVGDFDADGATASALSVSLLQALGASNVEFLVPNRFEFGYGLTPEMVALALKSKPNLIITVDNGISSINGVQCAVEAGIDVVVTDHHLPGDDLPAAYAIVNPNQAGCEFPSKNLAGVGVVWYLLSVVRSQLRARGAFTNKPEPNPADWLDLVALGTVADVVVLDHNNRILIDQGLKRMRAGRARPGIRALAKVAGRELTQVQAQDLAFALGPRLNAAGRLEDMSIGIRCLLATTDAEAVKLATALNELNRARRSIEQEMTQEAELAVLDLGDELAESWGLTVHREHWHQGIVGIVAGRMRERFNRPVIAFAEAGATAPDELKGSARSIAGLHIRDVLAAIDAKYPGLILRFGGHAMAAGLSLKRRHYKRFSRAFDSAVAERLDAAALEQRVWSDGTLEPAELDLGNAETLAGAGPWGQGFPEPLFHGDFELVSQRVVGENHLKMVLGTGGSVFDAIKFRQATLPGTTRVRIAYHLSVNEYRERRSVQLLVEHLMALN